jgi:glycosyltransferase involved in cell wall biosynthesis
MPAYNEANSTRDVIANCKSFVDEIIVADNDSTDDTTETTKKSGAAIIRNLKNLGVTIST